MGGAEFSLISGKARLVYAGYEPINQQFYTIQDNKLNIVFSKIELEFTGLDVEIRTRYEPSSQKNYRDSLVGKIPNYLTNPAQKLELIVTMFEDNKLTLRLQGDLTIKNTQVILALMDEMGDSNGIIDQTEFDSFETEFKNNFGFDNFFEFTPSLDSGMAISVSSLNIENAIGNISQIKTIYMEIAAAFQFNTITENLHNITMQLLTAEHLYSVGQNFIFEFIYSKLTFNFSNQFKYWEFVNHKTFPPMLVDNLNSTDQELRLSTIEYEILKNRLGPEGEFGFFIDYNETAAEQAEDLNKENDDDKSAGFLPGFEFLWLMITFLIVVLVSTFIVRLDTFAILLPLS